MKTISLSQKPLLESLVTLDVLGYIVDLHNDFQCKTISIENSKMSIVFLNDVDDKVEITLLNAEIIKQDIVFDFSGLLTLDNLYRGRLLIDGILKDTSNDGRFCVYIHFIEDVYFEILTSDATLSIESIPSLI